MGFLIPVKKYFISSMNFLHVNQLDDMLLYIWEYGYECDYNTADVSWERIEKIFPHISVYKELPHFKRSCIYTLQLLASVPVFLWRTLVFLPE